MPPRSPARELVVFLEGFKIFNDKSLAINVETGLSEQFTDFIVEHHLSGQKIAVGKLEYKKIIEEKLVNEDMIIIAATLYECDYSVNRFAEYLHRGDKHLQSVSGISSEDWDLQRLAAALKLICYPEEKIETGVSNEMLSEEMAKTLVADAHKYEDLLHKGTCLDIYREILWVRAAKSRALTLLESSIKKAKGACAIHNG
ncbi:hypothetical protein PR202_gb26476 [Eleusine coracana subsp. coracana]|uniref:Uncharacterized protein n=1 Tax=Eleusine coracana subsp. coracana TaxID=191504 RepID=A0AAV5FRY3_ELECO|nr:hypothetical protein PR202_gb26476 [Eleusine coracana subsp. coracana]